jgi:hypothetical protein
VGGAQGDLGEEQQGTKPARIQETESPASPLFGLNLALFLYCKEPTVDRARARVWSGVGPRLPNLPT